MKAHNKNKPSITPHTSGTTSRVLSECELYMPKYDNDADMKSVKEIFERQTSRRFEEYEERMITQRQKYKEQRDKDIQKIIHKDKMEKNIAEKIEKGCLRCGCGLGGVAAGVGIFGALGTYGWKIAATAMAYETAKQAGIQAGIDAAIAKIKTTRIFQGLSEIKWLDYINESNYSTISGIVEAIQTVRDAMSTNGEMSQPISRALERVRNGISTSSDYFIGPVVKAANNTTVATTESAKTAKLGEVTTASSNAYSAIGYSVTVILIIVLVMIIIYLILRYRRKKKMTKKLQYTKLLNQ
ncbi:hypothetical protein PFBG_05941 [Plasmodium falciparum 7G8]|uniref:Rifin n=1 Tax=Plasmodium falciparum (isolate 7G8) TaxID=57266 RepID=W7ET35_PLAF8|nr:hypothetical protein PFBG_05941 [Plasmodium falciparum 7G8]